MNRSLLAFVAGAAALAAVIFARAALSPMTGDDAARVFELATLGAAALSLESLIQLGRVVRRR